jgi:RHS repeat-associated protein
VTAVVDHSGHTQERYAYSPYGKVTVLDANFAVDADGISDIGNTHFYTGRELDAETGLQLNRNRFYGSHLGRWVGRDPIDYSAGAYNLYEYDSNEPISSTDPFGVAGCTSKLQSGTTPRTGKTHFGPFDLVGSVPGKYAVEISWTATDKGLTLVTSVGIRGRKKGGAVGKATISVECKCDCGKCKAGYGLGGGIGSGEYFSGDLFDEYRGRDHILAGAAIGAVATGDEITATGAGVFLHYHEFARTYSDGKPIFDSYLVNSGRQGVSFRWKCHGSCN